jgi:hypothetical protein
MFRLLLVIEHEPSPVCWAFYCRKSFVSTME